MNEPQPYRIFICYAHENDNELKLVVEHLRSLGVTPRWSGALQAGSPFPGQIKEGISRAHLFLPILTASANARPWVHQEIGFALAANVPLLPLAVGELPTGLAEEIQAIQVAQEPDQLKHDLQEKLTYDEIETAVTLGSGRAGAFFEAAPLHEDRTRMLVAAAQWLLERRKPVRVRQWGAFTSFSLPDADYRDRVWRYCDGSGQWRSWGLRRDLALERQLLERHARQEGCDLVIDPNPPYTTRGESAWRARLEILVEFLESMPDDKVRAVVLPSEEAVRPGNLLLLGDWFAAESITPRPGLGYLQTLGTWHAPSVLARVDEFDRLFAGLFSRYCSDGNSSREKAIADLRKIIETLPDPREVYREDDHSEGSRGPSNSQ